MTDTFGIPDFSLELVPAQNGELGPFLLSDLENALATYVANYGQASGYEKVYMFLRGPVNADGPALPRPELVPAQSGEGDFLLTDLENLVAAYAQNSGQAAGSVMMVFKYKEGRPMGGPKIATIPSLLDPANPDTLIVKQGSSGSLEIWIRSESFIRNDGRLLPWIADANAGSWLTLDKTSGTLQPHTQDVVNVTVDTTSLDVGTYPITLKFINQVPGNPDVQVSFTLIVVS
ncbi:MAG TPA: hypothetical protein VJO32_17565 [Ktedonobacteraceae bacterium]|nr:hypothetical protein [Ktedonobacteraceae bacterium]